jgi:glycine cleavage system regulatory protein
MNTNILFSFIGIDKPGLVEKLSNTVSESGGNWLESRMSQLSGYFTGIVRVQIISSQQDILCQSLTALNSPEINITIHQDQPDKVQEEHRTLYINLLGNDRPGIVLELSSALATLNINVCEMNTNVVSAAMTAESLFEARIEIHVPMDLDINVLNDKLDEIANELSVDITLDD